MSLNAAIDSFWGDGEEGKEVEWTDFGSNALFAVKSEEAPSDERIAHEEIRATKSSGGRLRLKSTERRLRQKSLERRQQIDTKIPIMSIRPKSNTDKFLSADSSEYPVMANVSVEVDEERGEVAVASSEVEERGTVASPVPSKMNQEAKEIGEEHGRGISVDDSDFSLEPVASGTPVAEKAVPAATTSGEAPPEMAPTKSSDLSVYSKDVLSELPPDLIQLMSSLEDAENRDLTTSHVEDGNEQQPRNGRRRCLICGTSLILALVILGVALGVILGLKKSDPSSAGDSFVSPPTGSPPAGSPTQATMTLHELIASVSLDGGAALSDPLSPQSKALTWLDGNAALEEYPVWRKIQRYVLAVFFYATNGSGWIESDGWLTNENECDWFTSDVYPTCDENDAIIRLALSNNNVTGTLPKDLAILSDSLQTIAFRDAPMMEGEIAPELGMLSKLETLHIFHTSVSSSLPSEVGLLTNLVSVEVNNNAITGVLPSELAMLSQLDTLALQNNNMSGPIPIELGSLVSTEYLYLQNNTFTGAIPSEFGSLDKLYHLGLQDNEFSSSIPSELGNLKSLDHMWLQGNDLRGTLPVELTNASNLVGLYLSRNMISGAIPSEIAKLTNLTYLHLNQNELSGSLPSEIGLMGLVEAAMSDNYFSGSIPTEIGLLGASLKLLSISSASSSLSGPLPTEIGNLTKLRFFTLYSTNIEGDIPTEIGLLSNLGVLILGGTKLSGSIPTEIGNLTELTRLFLAQNELKSTIPTEIGALTNLIQFSLHQQKLFGKIPSELMLLSSLDSFIAFDNDFNGPFTCPEFIESCAVSCSNGTDDQCRVLSKK